MTNLHTENIIYFSMQILIYGKTTLQCDKTSFKFPSLYSIASTGLFLDSIGFLTWVSGGTASLQYPE